MHERGCFDDDDIRTMHEGKYPKSGCNNGCFFLWPETKTFKQLQYNEFRTIRAETCHPLPVVDDLSIQILKGIG
jgi:hypothetical protein